MTDETADDEVTPSGRRKVAAADPARLFALSSGVLAAVRETAIVVILSLVIATLVRIFLVQAFLIPSKSMLDTLWVGDRVLVNKLAPRFGEIQRGDVVVFEDPGGWLGPGVSDQGDSGPLQAVRDVFEFVGVLPSDAEGHLIKRVIGVGGDTVACCDDSGRVTVNGVPIDEQTYLYPGDEPSSREFEEKVPQGSLFVMGDHRSNSGDSRVNGFVPEDRVTGRAFVIVWPIDRWQLLERPDNFPAVPGG